MLSFGFSFGKSHGRAVCVRPQGEVFDNRNFDCGIDHWETNSYGGSMLDNNDGTITFSATDLYSSITQLDKFPIPAGRYHIGVVVSNVSGNGKYAYRTASGWTTAFEFSAPGTYEMDIDVAEEITAIDIGAHGDDTFVCTFDGVACIDTSAMPMPDWYKIASLDSADILGVWDWTWLGHGSQSDTLVNLDGSMPNMSIDAGTPTWAGHAEGINFGGAGSIRSRLPDGLDMRNLTVLMEFHKTTQNATLDAFYSHYNDTAGRYTLQNGWGEGTIRWVCGDDTATTIAIPGNRTEGVIATAGRSLYFNDTLLGTVDDSGPTSTNGADFRFGCIWTTQRTQFVRTRLKKLLIVQRELTEAEVQEIYSNITGAVIAKDYITYEGDILTYDGDKLWR